MSGTDSIINNGIQSNLENEGIQHNNLKLYGYLILISTWLLFTITIISFFKIWKFIIYPLNSTPIYDDLLLSLESFDDVLVKLWCIYIVFWWWAFISWTGLKLFRHSKGIQT